MIKTCTFAVMHFGIAFGVAYAVTGDIVVGGTVALVEPLANTLGYHLHEKIWQRVREPPKAEQELGCSPDEIPA